MLLPLRQRCSWPASSDETAARLSSSGAVVGAELLDGGLVDQANLVVIVHDDDAFAQVLNDVLIELDEVAQVEAALLGERFGFDEACAQELHHGRDHEDYGAEDAHRRELGSGRDALQLRVGLLAEQDERRHRREQERALRRQQQGQRSDGYDEDAAEAARDAAARVNQERDRDEVGGELQIRLAVRARCAPLQQHEKRATGHEQADQRAPRQRLVGLADDARRVDEVEHDEQHGADREPEEIEKSEDSPSEVRRCRIGCWTRRRFRALRVDGIDGGHGAGFYLIAARRLGCVLCGTSSVSWRIPPPASRRDRFPMNLHEYQSKVLFAEYGIPVPKGQVATTPQEAKAAAAALGGSLWVVKAQVHAGGRGKAGGVKLAKSAAEVEQYAKAMLGTRLVTHQSGAEGLPIDYVYVEAGLEHRARALLELGRRPQLRAHRRHGLGRRRHGHRRGCAQDSREDRHADAQPGGRIRGLPGPQARLRPRLEHRAASRAARHPAQAH